MAAHAMLSASGATRWISCPPSARLESNVADQQSVFAAEGTLAHALAEIELRKHLKLISKKDYNLQRADIEIHEMFNPEMHDYIEEYTDLIVEKINDAKAVSEDAVVLLEERLDYSHVVPEGFGTGDVVLIYDKQIEVIDLKYGKGVAVEAENNPQMRLYGLGAFEAYDMLYDIEKVKTTIIQPRLNSVTSEEISPEELNEWAETVVRPAAEKAWKGEGDFKAGDHCKFCKVRATCRERANANLELAKYDFQEPELLAPEEIADILEKAAELKNWASDVESYALDQAENHGVRFPGYKLVEGRSNRKYVDDDEVAKALIIADYDESTIFEQKLLGITKLEKAIGKKAVNELLCDLIIKPPGKPTLVPLTDKRPEISSVDSAKADFKED